MYDRREIDGAIAELENAEPTMQRVLDTFMDVLKRESPEAIRNCCMTLKISEGCTKVCTDKAKER